jgi:hypothetical protein
MDVGDGRRIAIVDSVAKPQEGHAMDGLYSFAKAHLLVINAVVLASSTLVGLLDFLAPRFSVLPKVVYSFTACLVALMVVFAFAPKLAAWLMSAAGLAVRGSASGPLWRRPGWQIGVAILLGITIIGFESVAKASQGGLIASAFPAARSAQESLLSIKSDVSDIKNGVGDANLKLDRLTGVVDPSIAADRCADIECAVSNGASTEAVRRLFAKGARLPGNPINDGAILLEAALSSSGNRLEVLDLLFQKGLDRDMMFLPTIVDPTKLTSHGAAAAKEIVEFARLDANPATVFMKMRFANKGLDAWNAMGGCFLRTSGGVTLIELASLMGDTELLARARAGRSQLPSRPLECAWRGSGLSGHARVRFDPLSGKYLGVASS